MPEDNTTNNITDNTTSTDTAESLSIINADGSFVENWHEKYGEENAAHLSRYKTYDDLVNSHISLRKKFNKNPDTLVEIPSETSSDEVRAAWAKAHGVPDTIEGYEYTLPDELATKLGPLDDQNMATLREFAQKKNWSQSDFKDVLDLYHTVQSNSIDTAEMAFSEQQSANAEAAKAELRKQNGWRTEQEYNANVQLCQSVMEKYDMVDFVAEANLQNSPKLLMSLKKIADSISEDTLKGVAASSGVTKDSLKTKIAENRTQMDAIMKKDPVNYRGDARFRELDKMNIELYKQFPV